MRSTGPFSFASLPHDCCGSPPTKRPSSEARPPIQPAPSRSVASTSGRLEEYTSTSCSGGTWLKTSCVRQARDPSRCGCDTVAMQEVKQMRARAPRTPADSIAGRAEDQGAKSDRRARRR